MTEIIESISIGFITFAVCLFIGMWLVARVLKRINDRLDAQLADVIKQLESKFVYLNIEVDNGVYFCYNKQDDSFVCQGTTAKEIREAFDSRYPDKIAIMEDADKPELAELKEQILEMKASES